MCALSGRMELGASWLHPHAWVHLSWTWDWVIEVDPVPAGVGGLPIAANVSKHCRISCQLVSSAVRWVAIVESTVKLSEASVVFVWWWWEEGLGNKSNWPHWARDFVFITDSLERWKGHSINVNWGIIWQINFWRFLIGLHQSKSNSCEYTFKSMPSRESSCCTASTHPISLASVIASGVNQQKTVLPWASWRYFGRYSMNSELWYGIWQGTQGEVLPLPAAIHKYKDKVLPIKSSEAIRVVHRVHFPMTQEDDWVNKSS